LPRFPHPSEHLALEPRGPALPVAPPDEVASCPASCIFGFCRRPSFELPRLASFSASPVEARVAPRFIPSAALPDASPRVAPASASSGHAGDRSSGCPESLILQHPRRSTLEFPPSSRFAVVPADAFSGLPRFLHLPAVPATVFQVALNRVLWRLCADASGFPSALLSVAPPGEVSSRLVLFTFRLCLDLSFQVSLNWLDSGSG
jgi:hypothetical protein